VRPYPAHGSWTEPNARIEIEHQGRRIAIYCVHVLPPARLELVAEQRRQIAWLAQDAAGVLAGPDAPGAVILAGDFNAPFHTNHLRELRALGLREAHSAAGIGRGATWKPRSLPFSLAPGVRLDNAMFSSDLRCSGARVGPDVGSDHRPIAAEFIWAH
jgi:endonuclease/exonuclease/phosphatase (EEP) superfamily protein YafD